MKRKDWYWDLIFVVPTLIVFSLVVLVPFVMGISYSFVSWDGIAANPKVFVGLSNYVMAMSDDRFIRSAVKTFIFTAWRWSRRTPWGWSSPCWSPPR